jgi:hypothetical protein
MEVFSWRRIYIFLVVRTRDFLKIIRNVRVVSKSDAKSVGK